MEDSAPSNPLADLSVEDREHYELTGDMPGEQTATLKSAGKPEQTASAPSTPDDQAAPTGRVKPPASEPGKPDAAGYEARRTQLTGNIKDLVAERARLEAGNARLRSQQQPPGEEPTKPGVSPASSTASDSTDLEPKEDDFDDYGKYIDARARWAQRDEARKISAQAEVRASYQAAVDAHERDFKDMADSAKARVEAAEAVDPEFESKVDQQLLEIEAASALPANKVGPHNVIVDEMLRSEATAELLVHFSNGDEGLEDFHRLCALGPASMHRQFGRLEERLLAARPGALMPAPPKTVTDAPTPPRRLGRRAVPEADAERSAVASGDIAGFMKAANDREIAGA